ncbi:flavin reductase [Methylopila turkensis]|uniref:FMN reductase (NADH) RutF n=1 Tax=Methylopila turkensis TaxID=1437816 RepID=A0A9W6JQE9_9HYPH|nr:flavin reductase [Methylopila turkensis]GLK80075.1 FMN reductase (NADH) RutF [Methylopila turkensis]
MNAMTGRPAADPERAAVSRDRFRQGMSRLSAAVTLVTTDGPAGRAGFTASAVCSLSDAPPSLLVCLNRSASVFETFAGNDALCVNVLAPGHETLSRLFGGETPTPERFAAAEWREGVTGAPELVGATAAFDCRIVDVSSFGSHDVLFCHVMNVRLHDIAAGLVYFDRRYHAV